MPATLPPPRFHRRWRDASARTGPPAARAGRAAATSATAAGPDRAAVGAAVRTPPAAGPHRRVPAAGKREHGRRRRRTARRPTPASPAPATAGTGPAGSEAQGAAALKRSRRPVSDMTPPSSFFSFSTSYAGCGTPDGGEGPGDNRNYVPWRLQGSPTPNGRHRGHRWSPRSGHSQSRRTYPWGEIPANAPSCCAVDSNPDGLADRGGSVISAARPARGPQRVRSGWPA
jgi:hypothetical protein